MQTFIDLLISTSGRALRPAMLFMLCFAGSIPPCQAQSSPSSIECKAMPYYKHRKDGKAGREILVIFKGGRLKGRADIEVGCNGSNETTLIDGGPGIDSTAVLLPAGAGVDRLCQARISIKTADGTLYQSIIVKPQRQWTVYIYPHSHVDIGYTNIQAFVRRLHMRNIDVAIDIARKTQHYPEGARFVWNPEALWVTENYLREASPEKKKQFIEAVRKGWISLDGNYANINTSTCSDEELLQLFHNMHKVQKLTGVPIKTMVQMDVAGASWGTVQAAAQNGVRAFFCYPNIGTIRRPWEHQPFYWVAPDGKSKLFFLQALPYGFGYTIKGSKIGLYKSQGNAPGLDRIATGHPQADFIDSLVFNETAELEAAGSPYNIFVVPWALADNALIDADLPDAVRSWNERYAYPKLIISGSQRIFDDYEKRYAGILPQLKGDYSEYWTDGLGSDTRRIGLYRAARENLVQAEAAWCMLHPRQASPRASIDSAWHYALMGAEHTWGYQNPRAPLAKKIEATKASYFENTFAIANRVLAETVDGRATPSSRGIAVFNTLSWARSGLIVLSKEQSAGGNGIVNEKGEAMPAQRLSSGKLAFLTEDIPALGTSFYRVADSNRSALKGCSIEGNRLFNGRLSVTIDPITGDVSGLQNMATGQEYVRPNSAYKLNSYRYLLWPDSTGGGFAPTGIRVSIKENGPLLVSLLITSKAEGCNWLTREVRLVYKQPWVSFINSFDKISTTRKEGIHFGFDFDVPHATARLDIPWGVMVPEYDQLPGGNRNWLSFQRWIDISNAHTGVTWVSLESPLVEFGGMTANLPGGAHGRSNWFKHISNIQPLFSWPLNNHWNTNFPLEQGGLIQLHYAVLPHGAYDATTANRFGMEQNRPLIAVPAERKPATQTLFAIDNPAVFISMLRQSDDGKGMILRLRSVSGKAESFLLRRPGNTFLSLYSCTADEKQGAPTAGRQSILPYGVRSYYIRTGNTVFHE